MLRVILLIVESSRMRWSTWPRMLLRNKARFARHQWQHSHHHRGKLSILKYGVGYHGPCLASAAGHDKPRPAPCGCDPLNRGLLGPEVLKGVHGRRRCPPRHRLNDQALFLGTLGPPSCAAVSAAPPGPRRGLRAAHPCCCRGSSASGGRRVVVQYHAGGVCLEALARDKEGDGGAL